jgi:antitoxin component YwqK of YwqJK toxin-antitoxin module
MKDYSTLAKGTFYKDTGELIGTYDYIYETGTLVKYTDNLEIVSIETTQDGKPLTKKEFGIYGEDKILTEPSYYVYAYTDYNKSGETYDETGEVLSFTEYREGRPYEGLVYNFDTENNLATETAYQEGKKVDKETIRNTETNEMSSVNFYEEGELIKVATYNEGILFKIAEYKDGELEGTTSFFSPDNKLISTVSFNKNLPIEGTYIYKQENYLVKTTFKDKNRITKQIYYIDPTSGHETLVMLEKYIDNYTFNRSVYNQTTGKLIYDYSIKENVLDGLLKYYEGDRLKHQATFENGKISGGTVAIIDFSFDPITDSHEDYPNHTVITKSKNTYHITIEDEAKKELLNMQIKETAGDNNYNSLFNTTLLIENLYPYNQLNNTPSEWKTYAPIKAGDLKPNILDSLF